MDTHASRGAAWIGIAVIAACFVLAGAAAAAEQALRQDAQPELAQGDRDGAR